MISSLLLKEFVGKKKGHVMLNAMAYHSPIKKTVRMVLCPRKDIGKGTEALLPITFFDLDSAISHYKERITDERYKHLIEASKRYHKTLSEFKGWLNESK